MGVRVLPGPRTKLIRDRLTVGRESLELAMEVRFLLPELRPTAPRVNRRSPEQQRSQWDASDTAGTGQMTTE